MELFLVNEELEKTIKEIKRKLMLSMNGVTSDHMKKYGIEYKLNYGVSIIRLREMASSYAKNHDLAQRLWNMEVRECMILATLIQPVEKFDKPTASKWIDKVTNIELAEQLSMNLLAKTPFAPDLVLEYANSTELWKQVSGFLLGARIYQQFNTEDAIKIIDTAISKSETEELHLYKSIATFLGRISRNGEEIMNYISDKTSSFDKSENTGRKYIQKEVKEEISFLKNLPD